MKTYTYYIIFFIFTIKNIEAVTSAKHVIRCTRRFTAGYCDDPVKPVWTFVFQKQDCVMRMGCPASARVNRFRKYSQCVRHCKVLVDLYTQILLNDTVMSDDPEGSPRRDMDGKPFLRSHTTDPEDPEDYEDEVPDSPHYDADVNDSLGNIIPGDIDGEPQVHTFLEMIPDNK